ncbi:proteoglycan 4-like [Neolamprologus brichardi]|uniref:proteoglycan 4-like n=1 Tax=Neolamprologus brichardi TaxID=32507 RepID=UPI001643A855|nr:proteoglycan 4-like [Neolamprologus brichardi]
MLYRFVGEVVVSLKKQLDMYVHSTKRQEDTVRRSLQDMESRLQSIEHTESRLRTELQAGFVAFAKLLKAKMMSLLKDIQKVYELECEQIHGRMVKMKQLQQSQTSMKETLEKARNLTDLPKLLSHTAKIKTQMKELLDQDSDPPLKMPEVKLITKLGYEETLSELCNLHVSWIPFAVPPTLDKNTGAPATPAAPPPTSTCNPISSTVMDSASASHSLNLPFTSSSAPQHGQDSTSFTSPSTCLHPGPQTETAGSSATPVPNDCAATPSPSSQSSSSSFCKFSPNLTLYNLLTHHQVGAQDSVNPRSPPSSSPSGQFSHALPPTTTSPATSNRPLPPSCNAPGAPTSRASPSCTPLSSSSTSITPPAHTSTFPLPTDTTPQTGKAMNCNPPATTSVLPPPSTPVSAQSSVPLSSTTAMFPSSITPSISTRPSLSALVSSQPTIPPSSTTSMFPHSSSESTITEVSPETSAGSCDGPSDTLPSEQQTVEDTSPALPSSSSLQELDHTLHPPSPQEQTQQVPVEGLVVDSRRDNAIRDTEEVQETKETEHATCVSDEAKPNALEPKDDAPTLVTPDKDVEEPSAVIGQEDFSLSRWQPKVSVLRLPVSLPRFGRSLPSFRLLPGETEDEIYLEEMSDDCQSDAEDVPADEEDFMKPESSPDSPITLEILACSVCASPGTSIICSACGRGYHRDCHVPPVGLDFWSEWACSLCQNLSDPSDPYSTERRQHTGLSLQSLRRCESLVLHVKVEVCSRCSQFGGLSRLKSISDRLTLRRPPPYQTAAELVSDMWTLFKDASQDDELQKLRESFRMKLVETLSSELHPSLLTAPNSNPQTAAGHASRSQHGREDEKLKLEKEEGLIPESKLEDFRKRLRDFLDLKGSPGPKRKKRNDD